MKFPNFHLANITIKTGQCGGKCTKVAVALSPPPLPLPPLDSQLKPCTCSLTPSKCLYFCFLMMVDITVRFKRITIYKMAMSQVVAAAAAAVVMKQLPFVSVCLPSLCYL